MYSARPYSRSSYSRVFQQQVRAPGSVFGVAAQGSAGTVAPGFIVSGAAATGVAGSVIAVVGGATAMGVSAQGLAGTPTLQVGTNVPLIGVSASGAVGNAIGIGGPQIAGVVGHGNVGNVAIALARILGGVSAVGSAGIVSVPFVFVSISGVSAVGRAATLHPQAITFSGVAAVGLAGILGPLIPVSLPNFVGTFDNRDSSEFMQSPGRAAFDELLVGGWDTSWHNSAAKFTLAAVVFVPSGAVSRVILANSGLGSPTPPGYIWYIDSSNRLVLQRNTGALSDVHNSGSAVVGVSAWNFVAVSLVEAGGAGASHFRIGQQVAAFDGLLPASSSLSPSNPARIMGTPDGFIMAPSGFGVMMLNAWNNRALSQSDTFRLYTRWRSERMSGLI